MTIVMRFFFLVLFALTLPIACARAQTETQPLTYIAPTDLPPELLLPPPAEGTAGWREQIGKVEGAQKSISADELTAIRDEQHVRLELMTGVIGKNFTAERFPQTFALLNRVTENTGAIVGADKKFWHTRRPYLTDPHVRLLVDPLDDNPSYPSGHTTEARVLAETLGLLYPQKLAVLRARAMEIAWHRVEAGVHYPVDIDGGNALAMLIMGGLMKDQDFQTDLAAARAEIAATP